jgi:hypothetical protein
MPKYLLLKHYTGGPERHPNFAPMSDWTEDEITAHMAFQRHVRELLRERSEFVDAGHVQRQEDRRSRPRHGGVVPHVSPHPGTSRAVHNLRGDDYLVWPYLRAMFREAESYQSRNPPVQQAAFAQVDRREPPLD